MSNYQKNNSINQKLKQIRKMSEARMTKTQNFQSRMELHNKYEMTKVSEKPQGQNMFLIQDGHMATPSLIPTIPPSHVGNSALTFLGVVYTPLSPQWPPG